MKIANYDKKDRGPRTERGVKHDRTVSEVIGAILIFALVIVLFTSAVVWYVPTEGSANDQKFISGTQSSFSSILSSISSGKISKGTSTQFNLPMGVPGTFLTPNEQSTLSLVNDTSSYLASMEYNLSLTYKYPSLVPSSIVENKIVKNLTGTTSPDSLAYDPLNNCLYVASYNSNAVNVYNLSTGTQIASIPVGEDPTSIVYDSGNGMLYVANDFTSSILTFTILGAVFDPPVSNSSLTEINPSNNSVVRSIDFPFSYNYLVDLTLFGIPILKIGLAQGDFLYSLTYDSFTNEIFGSFFTFSYTLFSGNTYFKVTMDISEFILNPSNGHIQTFDLGGNQIPVDFNVNTNSHSGAFSAPFPPPTTSFNPSNGYIYVANGSNLRVLNGFTNKLLPQEIVLNNPGYSVSAYSFAFDTANGDIYVTNSTFDPLTNTPAIAGNQSWGTNIEIVNSVTNKLVSTPPAHGTGPVGVVFDSLNNIVYVADYNSNTISLYNGFNNTYIKSFSVNSGWGPGGGSNSMILNPSSGNIYVTAPSANRIIDIQGFTYVTSSDKFDGQPLHNSFLSYGVMTDSANLMFSTPQTFALQDGSFITQSSNGRYVDNGLYPFSFSNGSSGNLLSTSLYSFGSSNTSYSSTTSAYLYLQLKNSSTSSWQVGQKSVLSSGGKNYSVVISAISLNHYNYSMKSQYAYAIYYAIYKQYDPSVTFQQSMNHTTFVIPNSSLEISLSVSNTVTIKLLSPMPLLSFESSYYDLMVNIQ